MTTTEVIDTTIEELLAMLPKADHAEAARIYSRVRELEQLKEGHSLQ